jgi:hypothetical protein
MLLTVQSAMCLQVTSMILLKYIDTWSDNKRIKEPITQWQNK